MFVCHCGSNIASVVDVEAVVEQHAAAAARGHGREQHLHLRRRQQDRIKDKIAEHRLNRVVVASCTPRTHEPIFRDTLRDAGLNPYLLEMANIRDQCSWVHSAEPQQATDKAVDLVRMAVARAAAARAAAEETVPVNNAALVVGGGIAGMTAALALADQGFPVHLVEKSGRSWAARPASSTRTLDGAGRAGLPRRDHRPRQRTTRGSPSTSNATRGQGRRPRGQFHLVAGRRRAGEAHGRASSTAWWSWPPGPPSRSRRRYGYGQSDQVLTQLELSDRLGRGELRCPRRPRW